MKSNSQQQYLVLTQVARTLLRMLLVLMQLILLTVTDKTLRPDLYRPPACAQPPLSHIFLKLFPAISSLRQRTQRARHPLMETKTTPQAITTARRKNSKGPDHPDQFGLNHRLTPAQMDHGVTDGDLSLTIMLNSPPEEYKPH